MDIVTTEQAAARLGISTQRVQALIKAGRLPARKVGRDWLIQEQDLDRVRVRKSGYPAGRPRKRSTANGED